MKKTIFAFAFGALSLLTLTYWLPAQAAGEVKLYLSPSSGSLGSGDTLMINLMEDSNGVAVNAVSTHITYPGSSLQLLSFTPSDDFSLDFSNSEEGVIHVSQGAFPPFPTENTLVATINFKVLASSGNINVSINPTISDDNSALYESENSTNILQAVYSGTYRVTESSQSTLPPPAPSSQDADDQSPASENQTTPEATPIDLPAESQALKDARQTSTQAQTATTESSSRVPDKTVLLSVPPAIILAAVASRYLNRKYGFISRSPHYAKESISDVAKRINKKHTDPKKETVAELAARMRRTARQ